MDAVIIERIGALGRIRLNRPAAINALTHDMVAVMDRALDDLEGDKTIAAILLSGEGSRGLCAGGDIRSLWQAPRVVDGPSMAFWRDEYRLNARIARGPKPFIAFMDGLVMGGGVGIAAHAAHRIVTEHSKIAFPECGIGFVPDVGATWLLPRAPGATGLWMGLTGRSLGAADAVWMGLADCYMPAERLPDLVHLLAALPVAVDQGADVAACLAALCRDPGPAPVAAQVGCINRAFAQASVSAIIASLAGEPGAFAAQCLADLRAKSPTALKLAFALYHRGKAVGRLEDALELEFAAARALVTGHDLYEGIRAAVIDKDRKPVWRPAHLQDVSDDQIARALVPADERVFVDREFGQ